MQLRHVSTNLRQGLRRNASMHLAVILTLFVSLSLAGIGLMMSKQADLTVDVIGSELQIQVVLCLPDDPQNASCTSEVTEEQKSAIATAIDDNPEVADFAFESKAESLEKLKALLGPEQFEGPDPVFTVEDAPQAVRITLKDPNDFDGTVDAVANLDGVSYITLAKDEVKPIFTLIDVLQYSSWGAAAALLLASILLVANTIRLTALARRKEIEIMRLVGASRIFIALPFLLEALVTALIGVALAVGAVAAFTQFALIGGLSEVVRALPFIGWAEWAETSLVLVVVAPILTVVPTLLLTRKYLRL
ncbi:permease-like cell division protein FtsX [Nocardioides sp.]|uniref:permease-like cell division protein FtsX n=1 Tax=Nocardioides sp. TaxID=35761 RepID=UPI000C8C25E5|nr:permease-like cell division protein FtsX [Nocardioides sp.]MAS54282.1 cell division protein FtsX [Pimelobacter sp.]MDE0776882.1 permease-like cell division protein FtsX [Nocardioides sp.]